MKPLQKLYTYEELMARYGGVSKRTVTAYFPKETRFQITVKTIRIKESEVAKFEKLTPEQRKKRIKRNKKNHGKK